MVAPRKFGTATAADLAELERSEGDRGRRSPEGGRGETVRAEPFDEVDLVVGELFGDEPAE